MDRDIGLSRRSVLAGLGTIGLASAGAGLGTSAYLADQETFENNQLTAGDLDMTVGWSEQYFGRTADIGDGVRRYDGMGTGDASDLHAGETGVPVDDAWLVAVEDPDAFLASIEQERVDISADPCGGLNVPTGLDAQGGDRPVVSLSDVKPGDFGGMVFDFALCDNPGYAWMNATLRATAENGHSEAEGADEDETHGVVELLDEVRMAVWVADGGDGPGGTTDGTAYLTGSESPVMVDSLRNCLAALETGAGVELPGDVAAETAGGTGRNCFSGGAALHSVACVWWLPLDHGNEVQGDGVEFDLGFYTEQCRHNDGSKDLVASYPFEGTAEDLSGNGYDGTLTNQGSYAYGPTGDQVVTFDGTNGYVNVPDAPGLDGFDAVTLAARMRLDGEGEVANTLLRKNGAYILQRTSDGYVSFAVWDGGLTDWRTVATRAFDSSDFGTWFHVAGVFDPSGPTYRLYLDGTEVDAASTTATRVGESTAPLTIGGYEDRYSLDGALDDVRIYSRALSAAEVQSLADSA